MPLNNTDCPRPFIHLYLQAQGKQAHPGLTCSLFMPECERCAPRPRAVELFTQSHMCCRIYSDAGYRLNVWASITLRLLAYASLAVVSFKTCMIWMPSMLVTPRPCLATTDDQEDIAELDLLTVNAFPLPCSGPALLRSPRRFEYRCRRALNAFPCLISQCPRGRGGEDAPWR